MRRKKTRGGEMVLRRIRLELEEYFRLTGLTEEKVNVDVDEIMGIIEGFIKEIEKENDGLKKRVKELEAKIHSCQ